MSSHSSEHEIEVTLDTTVIVPNSVQFQSVPSQDSQESGRELYSAPTGSFEDGVPYNYSAQQPKKKKKILEVAFCLLFASVVHVVRTVASFYKGPHQRPIPFQWLNSTQEYARNLVYNQENKGETVGAVGVAILGLVPILTQVALIGISKCPRWTDKLQKTICTYTVAATINNLLTDLIKNYVGYLRPIYYDACQPNQDFSQCTTASRSDLHHIQTSFPSGHTSFSFCMFLLLSLFLEQHYGLSSIQRLILAEGRCLRVYTHPPTRYRLVSVLSLLPVGVAIWVGASRIADDWHHPADVVGGAVLGASVAVVTHRVWFSDPTMNNEVKNM